jgi:hypothetical protein
MDNATRMSYNMVDIDHIIRLWRLTMPRGKAYPVEMREEARRLRSEGWSLGEISAKLGPPKHTLTLWVRGIELTPEQRGKLHKREVGWTEQHRALAIEANRQARLARIQVEKAKAELLLDTISNQHLANHIAAAMLYLGEGSKGEGAFAFANSNPHVIRYWLYLLRTSFTVDESKFCLQIMSRADQNIDQLMQYWTEVTGISRYIKGNVDARTEGIPTKRPDYKGVCKVNYHDVSIRRYLDALAHGLMDRASGTPA